MARESILEKIGLLSHQVTVEEVEAADKESARLALSFMRGEIGFEKCRSELIKLPALNANRLAQELDDKP